MNNEPNIVTTEIRSHRFATFVIGSIVISILLVMVALALYASSGTEQLDLSRPGLADIREQAQNDDKFKGFSSSGPLDDPALDEFAKLYDTKLKEATSVDAFGGDALSPKSLQIDQATAAKTTR